MINNILRGFIYFVVLVLVQVLILNNIHFLRVATPFLYLYFILKMPVGSSRTNVVFFSFLIGLTIDVFSNTPGMHAFACTLGRFSYHFFPNSCLDNELCHKCGPVTGTASCQCIRQCIDLQPIYNNQHHTDGHCRSQKRKCYITEYSKA